MKHEVNDPLTCRKPPNGGGCIRDNDFDNIQREQQTTATLMHRFQERVTSEFLSVFGALSRVETKVDRLLEGVEIGQVTRMKLQSIDYDPDEPTLTGREPELAATIWKARNAESIEREVSLRAQVAALQATIAATDAERKRNSERTDRADKLAWTKWEKIGGIIVAIIAALGGGVGVAQLLR